MIRKKYVIYIVLLLSILTGIFYIAQQRNSYKLQKNNQSETLQIDIALLDYRQMASEDGSELYRNLLEQASQIARQSNALLFQDERKFIDTSIELTAIQEKAQTLDGFADIVSLQKTRTQIQRDKVYYQNLKQDHETLSLGKQSFGRLLVSLLSMLGFVWFPLMSLVNSRLVVEEKDHESLVKGQPRSLIQRLVRICGKRFLVIMGIFIGSISYLALLQFFDNKLFGDFGSVEVIKQQVFVVISVLGKMSYFVLFGALLYLASFLLSIMLNTITNNSYVTVIVECLVYSLLFLFPSIIQLSVFQWLGILSPSLIIDGQWNLSTNQGLIILITMILILFIICVWQLTFTKRGRQYE
ncbi:hypothetical protein [Vagococcus bubulae]|uniref:ABC transporter permease n=1 Tax=Vagococcus bubulae TaxID=1977868 RepID=A0A429ZEX6_9ENTE|nr:hypothetical protein [Vagococcus bubulae]RST92227.1 hypothetical protein CBF36_09075 [Vagococcus bubulae]